MNICICLPESLYCTFETNNIVNQLKKKKPQHYLFKKNGSLDKQNIFKVSKTTRNESSKFGR